MKQIIMNATLPLLFKTQEQLNEFIRKYNWEQKQTESGINYLIRNKNEDNI